MGNPRDSDLGDWRPEVPCPCGVCYLRSKDSTTYEVPMMHHALKVASNVGRGAVATAGLAAPALALAATGPVGALFCAIWGLSVGFVAVNASNIGADTTHNAIVVEYECTRCGRRVYKTYEIIRAGDKRNEWGRYHKTVGNDGYSFKNLSHEAIERIFDGMWTDYNLAFKNCKQWCREMLSAIRR